MYGTHIKPLALMDLAGGVSEASSNARGLSPTLGQGRRL